MKAGGSDAPGLIPVRHKPPRRETDMTTGKASVQHLRYLIRRKLGKGRDRDY